MVSFVLIPGAGGAGELYWRETAAELLSDLPRSIDHNNRIKFIRSTFGGQREPLLAVAAAMWLAVESSGGNLGMRR